MWEGSSLSGELCRPVAASVCHGPNSYSAPGAVVVVALARAFRSSSQLPGTTARQTVLVAPGDQGLEHLLGGHPDLPCDRLGGQVVGIDLVGPQLERDAQVFQQAHGV